MNNIISTEDQYEQLLIEGTAYLQQHVTVSDLTRWTFLTSMCMRMVDEVGEEIIMNEFKKNDYEDPQFVFRLAASIEFGVPVFIIQTNLYERLINTNKLLPVVVALNFSFAQEIAIIFDRLNLRHSSRPCIYANSALIQLVNRTMGRFRELNNISLNKFADVLLKKTIKS